jgi:DNA-binding beta-propeller fold protein YncE
MRNIVLILSCFSAWSLCITTRAGGAGEDPGWYQVNSRFGEDTETMPKSWRFGIVSGVAVTEGEVFVYQRGRNAPSIVVFDREGKYQRSWRLDGDQMASGGEHGLRVDREGNVWVTHTMFHQVIKFDQNGQQLLTLGIKGQAGTDDRTFNMPTDLAFGPDGEIYVSDGYGNSRVVKFSKQGQYLTTWGKKGSEPGEFDTPHSIAVDSQGRVYVSDRGNRRIQIFDSDGEYLKEWKGLGATQNIFITPKDDVWVVGFPFADKSDYEGFGGRTMKIDIDTGQSLRTIESPGHWIHVTPDNHIFIASLVGNVFHWYPRSGEYAWP